ncbi:uncharacterized protein LOC133791827 [Humulus lupulus]|uniref:uncharacterized protein LOC133791827 n=1 Tax=Humulus lupulus TaxID=3486 RepID=UPI002B400897|nr:uncharacterized protein LOC133791827 [Humulus lupulus]
MVSRNYRPSMEKSSIDLNRKISSTSVSETQPEHSVEGLENVVLHNEDESRHKCKVKWSKEATILLISGWLNTSKDAIVGNDQTSTHFWARIAEYYNTNQKGEQARTGRQCKDHWNKMNQKVARFNGCYKRVQQAHHNGWSDEQILENAHQLYKSKNNNSNFLLVDCWRLLKDEPKWNTMYQPKGGKRTKVSDTGAFTSSSNADISDDEKASALEKLVAIKEKEATIKEKEAEDNRMTKYMDYLIMDTSHMTPEQKKDHENLYSPNSLNPYDKMSLEDIIIAECTDDHDDQYFKALMDGGSSTRQGRKRAHIDRGHVEGHQRLFDDYFSDEPVYTEYQFRRRFRMCRHVFLRIVQALENHSEYFHTRFDAVGRRGLSPLQKCTAAMRMLAYGAPADYVDEYVRIGETTAIECLVNFVRGVNDIFGTEYLRWPNAGDIRHLLQMGEVHGFPGQFTRGDHGRATIMLEAVASQDLWIWHAFFGVPGSNNDLNVLNQSPIFTDILQGQALRVEFTINGTQYNKGYYLADGIYPEWGTFVKNIPLPQGEKRKLFSRCQEAVRKDVERAFGVLQSRFAIVRGPARFWQRDVLKDIMYACIILHTIIVEDERDAYENLFDFNYDDGPADTLMVEVLHEPISDFPTMLQRNTEIRDRNIHHNLQADLVEHIWSKFGNHFN